MRKTVLSFALAALVPAAGQAALQRAAFDVPVSDTSKYQTFCPDQSLDTVMDFFEQPKKLSGYLASGQFFKSRSKSSFSVDDGKITHEGPGIAAVYFFKEGTHQGRKGTFISAKGFFDQSRNGRWKPMIAVLPRSLDGDVCYTLKS